MQEASQRQDNTWIVDLSQSMYNYPFSIDRLFEEPEVLTINFEGQRDLFEKRLAELENPENRIQL